MQRFVDLAELTAAQVHDLVALATRLETRPEPQALAGKVLGLLFMNPSVRTLASFQSGMAKLGGSSFVITPGVGSWQFETRTGAVMDGAAAEHIREGLPVLASYCDVLGIRAFAAGTDLAADLADVNFNAMAALVERPLINLESAINHPCQALADWKTLDELPTFNETIADTIKAYLARDLKELARLTDLFLSELDPRVAGEFRRRLITERNHRMEERLEPIMARQSTFTAVGAMHLPGERGLLALLAAQGFRVSVVY